MTPLDGPWSLTQSSPGQWSLPSEILSTDWLPALVPGTVGAALQAAGRWQPDDDVGFDAFDFWYRSDIAGHGPTILRFAGLATIVDVFLDDRLVLRSQNMFVAYDVAVVLDGAHQLSFCFRSLDAYLATQKGRARWRPRLVRPPALRFARTQLLGHIPGWGPPVHAVGPWRPVSRIDPAVLRIEERDVRTALDGDDGIITLAIRLSAPPSGWIVASIGAIDFTLIEEADGWLRGRMTIPNVERWWPHTHGAPTLHALRLFVGDQTFDLGTVGFRSVVVDRDSDGKGFGLVVNGVPIFCRGACWTTPDIVTLPFDRAAYDPLLQLMVDAGMNMVRIGGSMSYEGDAFYQRCDALGLMVWQDFAFSNFDYPATDPSFCASVGEEARQFLQRTQASPCLTVLCGASEVAQQSAMMGLPAASWTNAIFETLLPAAVAACRPDVPYVSHSPCGGALPFVADEGISHYYGVSAHRRPVEEARRAGVRFSAESLGFANVPDKAPFVLEDGPTIAHPRYTERHPHDSAESWAFEGVRNHYCEALYGVDVAAVRADDPARFLALARATSAEIMEATYAEWRRAGSVTRGALVWFLRDLAPGAGWGVIDSRNEPKAAYYGLLRAFRPVTVVLTDENLNGLKLSLINETAHPRHVTLTLVCLRDGATPVMRAARDLVLEPRSTVAIAATDLWGGFFDTTYVFRFGEPSHDVTVARLVDTTSGTFLAEAFHFPLGRGHAVTDPNLKADVQASGSGWRLALSTDRLAQSVRIECDGHIVSENWFHLAPGHPRVIDLQPTAGVTGRPSGRLHAINSSTPVLFN